MNLVFTNLKAHFYRNMMPVLPLASVLAGVGFYRCWTFLARRRSIFRPVIPIVLLFLFVKLCYGSISLLSSSRAQSGISDNRYKALLWFRKNLKVGERALFDVNLHSYIPSSGEIAGQVGEGRLYSADLLTLWNRGVRYIAVPSSIGFFRDNLSINKEISRELSEVFQGMEIAQEFDGESLDFGQCPISPGVIIYKLKKDSHRKPLGTKIPVIELSGGGEMSYPTFIMEVLNYILMGC